MRKRKYHEKEEKRTKNRKILFPFFKQVTCIIIRTGGRSTYPLYYSSRAGMVAGRSDSTESIRHLFIRIVVCVSTKYDFRVRSK
jgi:hypothetical protein